MDNFFRVLVAGELPEDIMSPYEVSEVESFIVFNRVDATTIKNNTIKMMEASLLELEKYKDDNSTDPIGEYIKNKIASIKEMDDIVYFENMLSLNENYAMGKDGNIYSTENPYGKWSSFKIADAADAYPLFLKNGNTTYQARKGDVDWGKTHLPKESIKKAERLYDLIVNDFTPLNELEEGTKEFMLAHKANESMGGDKDVYVKRSASFWYEVFLSDDGWKDIESKATTKNIEEWCTNYYNTFIKDLPDNTLLTIYKCSNN